ncbi:hypothetical protein J7K41_04245 [Candidatus Micrarchaeota archaeon]|nr:hypothetical protein [Candidatus Micrarchaeota archaeon]
MKKKRLKTKMKKLISLSLVLFNMGTFSPLTELSPHKSTTINPKTATVETLVSTVKKTELNEEKLSEEAKMLMKNVRDFYEPEPYVAGSAIIGYYKYVSETDREYFDMKILEYIKRLEEKKKYNFAGFLCLEHVETNGELLKPSTFIMFLRLAEEEYKKASVYLNKIGDKKAAKAYKNSAKEIDDLINRRLLNRQ